jgi:hypothetical protein
MKTYLRYRGYAFQIPLVKIVGFYCPSLTGFFNKMTSLLKVLVVARQAFEVHLATSAKADQNRRNIKDLRLIYVKSY